jgi:hypothetical protein
MASIVVAGDTSGTVTLAAPSTAGTTTLTLPTTSGTVLTSASSVASSQLPTGSVLQVLQTVKTDTFSSATTNSWVDVTGLSVAITPSSSSNKILVMAQVMAAGAVTTNNVLLRLVRDSTAIDVGATASNRVPSFACTQAANDNNNANNVNASFLDSPSTTSSTTYKIQAWSNSATMYINRSPNDNDASYAPRGASTITVMEIKG